MRELVEKSKKKEKGEYELFLDWYRRCLEYERKVLEEVKSGKERKELIENEIPDVLC